MPFVVGSAVTASHSSLICPDASVRRLSRTKVSRMVCQSAPAEQRDWLVADHQARPPLDAQQFPCAVGIRPSTAKRHLADLRARSGLTTVELVYAGRAAGWLAVPELEPERTLIRP